MSTRKKRRADWPVASAALAVRSRPRGMLLCCGMAFLLHGIAFFSPWSIEHVIPELPQEQSVEIELDAVPPEPVSEAVEPVEPEPVVPPEPEAAPEPEPAVSPEPEAVPEPEPTPPVVRKKQPRPQKKNVARQSVPQKETGSVPAATAVRPVSPQPVVTPPEPLPSFKNRKPAYPKLARQRGQEGTVLLRVRIDPSGSVLGVEIIRSSGYELLDNAAVTSLRRWHFKPAESDGVKVSGSVIVPVEFRLR